MKHRPNVGQITGNVHLHRNALSSHVGRNASRVVQQDFRITDGQPDR